MEDEECMPENSSLKLYLQNLGFSDLQVKGNSLCSPSSVKFELPKLKSKSFCEETIDEEVIEQITIIVSTQMLFEEDVSNIEKLLSSFKVVKKGMIKSMFKDLFGVSVFFMGLCLFWVIGYYTFLIVSSFYAFAAAKYLTKKHFDRARLKKLTSILHANFILVKKSVKFIEEHRLIELNFCNNNKVESTKGFDFYYEFKTELLQSVSEMIKILSASTQNLITKVPLYSFIENPEFYVCNNYNDNHESLNLSKAYEIYLLVQSEFLQRLILSLIPNVKLSRKDDFHDLNQTLTETCLSLLKIKNKLNKKFKFLFLNGIYHVDSKYEIKLPVRNEVVNNYSKDFFYNIHEISKIFQNLLLKCRKIEGDAESVKTVTKVEEELVKMQADLNLCQKSISESLILLKKGFHEDDKCKSADKVEIQEEIEERKEKEANNSAEKLNKIMVGYTDLDPNVEDEIFEAYFTSDDISENLIDFDEWGVKHTIKKEQYKNFMKELKLKLVDKAKYWKKREKELLLKKGLVDGDGKISSGDVEKELANELDFSEKNLSHCDTNCTDNVNTLDNTENSERRRNDFFLVQSQNSAEDPTNQTENENCERSNILNNILNKNLILENTQRNSCSLNRSFLNDINRAREKMFKSEPIKEELFCASDDDLLSNNSNS